jgi:hypothetical protein
MVNRADEILEVDPGEKLPSRSDRTAHSDLKRQEHARERPTRSVEHNADPQVHDPDPGLRCRSRRSLPLIADPRQEALAPSALLGQWLLATVSVEADGRCRDEDARRGAEGRERLAERAGPVHPARSDRSFSVSGPASVPDARAREVNHGVASLEKGAIHSSGKRVPPDLGCIRDRGPSDQGLDSMPPRGEKRNQRGTDEARRPAHHDTPRDSAATGMGAQIVTELCVSIGQDPFHFCVEGSAEPQPNGAVHVDPVRDPAPTLCVRAQLAHVFPGREGSPNLLQAEALGRVPLGQTEVHPEGQRSQAQLEANRITGLERGSGAGQPDSSPRG